MKKSPKNTIITIILLISAIKAKERTKYHGECPKNSCIDCVGHGAEKDCMRCANLVTDVENKTCGISIKNSVKYYGIDKSLIKHCNGLEMGRYSARCFMCDYGYTLTYEGKCKKIVKKNCEIGTQFLADIVERVELKNSTVKKKVLYQQEVEECLVCKRRFPTKYDLSNPQKDDKLSKYGVCSEKIDKRKFPHCKYGTKISKVVKIKDKESKRIFVNACSGCDSDQYTVNVLTNQCELFPKDMLGCARMLNTKCISCNHYRGYYMTSPGVCTKGLPTIFKNTLMLLLIFLLK